MPKVINYLYPNIGNLELKVFQDKSSKIRAFYFNKDTINEVLDIPSSDNTAIYFLLNKSEIFVGKSENGVYGIKNIEDYEKCIMFVKDNNKINNLSIGYLQDDFIEKVMESDYELVNREINKEILVDIYEIPILENYIEEINILLKIEGINLQSKVVNHEPQEQLSEEKKKKENKEKKEKKGERPLKELIPINKLFDDTKRVALDKCAMERAPPKITLNQSLRSSHLSII